MGFSHFLLLLSFVHSSLGVDICTTSELTTSSGVIRSPNYPSDYGGSLDCKLTVKLPLDTKITFTFEKIDVESQDDSSGCYDSLTIKDIYEKEFCGTTLPAPYTPILNVIELNFQSDDSTEQSGFSIAYASVKTPGLPPAISVCASRSVDAIATGGRIMSPSFPSKYGNNKNCKLTLNIPPNKKTNITFINVDLAYTDNCATHKLNIKSSGGGSKTMCGTGVPKYKEFEGNEVSFQFITTSNSNNHRGFILSYQLIDIPTTGTTPSSDESCACSPGNWYIKRGITVNDVIKRARDDIIVEFKTTEKNATFIFAKGNVRDYIHLKLENSAIVFEVDVGTGVLKLNAITSNLNDNNWHKVVVTRNEKYVKVKVDDSNEISGTTPGPFTRLDIKGANGALYVLGGYSEFPHTFNGCIRNMVIDNMKPVEAVRRNDGKYSLYGGNGSPSTMRQC